MSWPDPWQLLVAYVVASYVIIGAYWIMIGVGLRRKALPLVTILCYLVPIIAISPFYLLAAVVLLIPWVRRHARRGED